MKTWWRHSNAKQLASELAVYTCNWFNKIKKQSNNDETITIAAQCQRRKLQFQLNQIPFTFRLKKKLEYFLKQQEAIMLTEFFQQFNNCYNEINRQKQFNMEWKGILSYSGDAFACSIFTIYTFFFASKFHANIFG